MKRRLLLMLAVPAAVAGLAAGCGGDDDEPATLAIEATQPSADREAFVVPESVEAGLVEVRFTNSSKVPREMQLLRLDDDRTLDDALEVITSEESGPIPDWLHAEGGIGTTAPGESASATLALSEGTYYLIDTNEGEGENVPSNVEKGARATLKVSGGDDEAELPELDASIEMDDYSFVTSGLKPGRNRFVLSNTGEELHHTLAFPIREDATFAEVREFLQSEGEGAGGPPPLDFEQAVGTSVLDGGRDQIAELDFEAGRYALVCFITDRAGGPPHVAKGMLREIEIS
jgi:hypothetical protein